MNNGNKKYILLLRLRNKHTFINKTKEMKNLVLFAAILMGTAFASCSGKKAQEAPAEEPAIEATAETQEVVEDTVVAADTIATDTVATEAVAE